MTVTNKHVLIVDDEPFLVRLHKRQLENGGYTVSVSTTSLDALDLVMKNPSKYDLLLTDLMMPGLSGKDLIQKVLMHVSDLPIIVLTGLSDKEIEKKLYELGVKKVLEKPLLDDILVETINRVLMLGK